MTSVETTQRRNTAADTVAGFFAVGSIVLSAIALGGGLILELQARPARTSIVAAILALVSGRLSARYEKLSLLALFVAIIAFVVGMSLAVITENALI